MNKRKILVADDEPTIRMVLSGLLKREGYEVFLAKDGEQALQQFDEVEPDMLLLDLMMPGLNGFEVCEKIKSKPENRLVPIIMVTASSAPENRMKGLEAGADDFLAKPVDRIELIARVRSLLRIKGYTDELERAESVLFALARSIEGKDPYTEGHCERLSVYGEKLGRELGMSKEDVEALRVGGIVHDVGKVAVPDAILLKPGKLTPEEVEVIRKHPVLGEEICKSLKSFRLVLPIIRHHHERYDGSGYPDGLVGEEIPRTARVLQTVDVFDALTTERPYKRALSIEKALTIMQDEVNKGWWDAEIYQAFRRIVLTEGFKLEPDETNDRAVAAG